MGILRCTAKYRKAQKLPERLPEPPMPSGGALGDWYADNLNLYRLRLFHFHSSRARLSVIIPMAPTRTAEKRFIVTPRDLMQTLGVPQWLCDKEIAATLPLEHARTTDRSVLGTMRDHAQAVKTDLYLGLANSLADVMVRLADTPTTVLEHIFPERQMHHLLKTAFEHA